MSWCGAVGPSVFAFLLPIAPLKLKLDEPTPSSPPPPKPDPTGLGAMFLVSKRTLRVTSKHMPCVAHPLSRERALKGIVLQYNRPRCRVCSRLPSDAPSPPLTPANASPPNLENNKTSPPFRF